MNNDEGLYFQLQRIPTLERALGNIKSSKVISPDDHLIEVAQKSMIKKLI